MSAVDIALTLATRMSIPPRASAEAVTQPATAAPSLTSATEPITVPPPAPSSAAVAATASASLAQNATWAPSASRVSTTARPIPRVPPETSARKPARCRSMPVAFPFDG